MGLRVEHLDTHVIRSASRWSLVDGRRRPVTHRRDLGLCLARTDPAVLAGILAWFLVFKVIVDVAGALIDTGRPWWWVTLLLGLLELLLGIWAAGYPGRSLFVFVNLVGIYAVAYGFTELFAAFDLRGLDQRLSTRPSSPLCP